ncbi:hypothetical protein GCM10018980_15000 [Streptomyces capoamus]|uniref:Uncharacterized protein n=1 Tax=Streptomyces capoamus TaxID=68183 RepID=A0A919C373_9ACTN|nr:hypothetical protein [Streptomyces capoamus]GGW13893.1 hypothetical protein GCM10010501_19540 [Streptomyces libani subsp. rufus]GHG40616.1 hypothetical protein GCM10018980_15000 [Streptomyces capoamus]
MDQVGDKPEEVRKHLEEDQPRTGKKQPSEQPAEQPAEQDGQTAVDASGDETENPPTDS